MGSVGQVMIAWRSVAIAASTTSGNGSLHPMSSSSSSSQQDLYLGQPATSAIIPASLPAGTPK